MNLKINALALSLLCGAATLATSFDADAQRRQTAQQERQQKTAEIPVCAQPLGAIAVLEPESTNWWSGQQLASPAALIKVFVQRSRCFTLV
ncbi:MAG: peptidoglycan-binding protein, partial [Luteimonas sp.]